MDALNNLLKMEIVKVISANDNQAVLCEVLRLTEKELAVVHRIKVVGDINLIGKKNMYLPSEFKSMLGGEYDARFAGTTYFEIVESGLIIPIKFCELVTS